MRSLANLRLELLPTVRSPILF